MIFVIETDVAPRVGRVVPCLHFNQLICIVQQNPKTESQLRSRVRCSRMWSNVPGQVAHSWIMSWFCRAATTVSEKCAGTNRWTWVSSRMCWGDTGCHNTVCRETRFKFKHSSIWHQTQTEEQHLHLMLAGDILQDVNLLLRSWRDG